MGRTVAVASKNQRQTSDRSQCDCGGVGSRSVNQPGKKKKNLHSVHHCTTHQQPLTSRGDSLSVKSTISRLSGHWSIS